MLPLIPFKVILLVEIQVGLLHPLPPTNKLELVVAGFVKVAVPVTVWLPTFGLPPVPVASSLYVGVIAPLSFFLAQENTKTAEIIAKPEIIKNCFFILTRIIPKNSKNTLIRQ